jgi:hypothetical protein
LKVENWAYALLKQNAPIALDCRGALKHYLCSEYHESNLSGFKFTIGLHYKFIVLYIAFLEKRNYNGIRVFFAINPKINEFSIFNLVFQ